MKIDFASINEADFAVSPRDVDKYLITPRKSKHVWTEEELHLRSLLCDMDGTVLSSGWPKFRNYGENKVVDEQFRQALANDQVTFAEKLDGTLIILSCIDGRPHFRTRGNDSLGDFEPDVLFLVATKYPKLLDWYMTDNFLADILRREFSILFEYTAPTNRIVIRYEEPALTLLGCVDLRDLSLSMKPLTLHAISGFTGVPQARTHTLPNSMDEIGPIVRSWQDKEGVVARFYDENEKLTLLKIKATQYVRLHAIKFRLEGKVHKLACLLGIQRPEDVIPMLAEIGIDFETSEFIRPEMDAYLATLATVREQWAQAASRFWHIAHAPTQITDRKEHRKWFVNGVRSYIEAVGLPQAFFHGAMEIYDGEPEQAWLKVFSSLVMKESVMVVRGWLSNPNIALADLIESSGLDND